MRRHKKSAKHSLARLFARLAIVAGAIASLAFPALAHDGTDRVPQTAPAPQKAQASGYGGGSVCDRGFRVKDAECMALDIPEHAIATGRSYGTGWKCSRGYEEVSGRSCKPILVPANAFLRSTGYGWQCERGFRKQGGGCVAIVLPERAYLTENNSGTGWTCDRGHEAVSGTCAPITVPANAYLTNTNYGAAWACERGFTRIDGRCDAIILPANAYLDHSSYGPGWRCERGYEPLSSACSAIDLPENAYLDRSGNRWSCNPGFRLSGGACILGR